ncbi:MAG: DUF4924 family protein [Bacteroidales bacterium]|nr:DUF4924 family protein [Bacteroidales bacterium]
MLIAKEKKQTNIAEYILYMWQIEDIIRAFNFDENNIEKSLISQFKQSENVLDEIRKWYNNLIYMMIEENIKEKGHLQFINNIISDIYHFHIQLINKESEKKYHELYQKALPNINEFKKLSKYNDNNDIEICLNGLYAILLLKLNKKEISQATSDAIKSFSNLLAYLSKKYKEYEEGGFELS